MQSFELSCLWICFQIITVPLKVCECLLNKKMQQQDDSKCCLQTSLAMRNSHFQVFDNHENVNSCFCIFKHLFSLRAKEGLRVRDASGPSQRCCLNVLDCHVGHSAEHHCERTALLRAHNVRGRLMLRLLPLPHPRSMQLMLQAAFLAILHPPSASPRQKATKSQKSKKNAPQPRLEREKWSKNRS